MTGETRCLKCQSLLVDDVEEVARAIGRAKRYGALEALGDRLAGMTERLKAVSGWNRMMAIPEGYVPFRFPIAAAARTFVLPGLGQAYNHQPLKGAVYGVAWLAFAVVNVLAIRHPASNVLLLGLFAAWCGIWTDAYVNAARVNGQRVLPRTAIAVLCGILAILAFTTTILQMAGANLLVIKTIGTTAMAPGLRFGDLVLVNHTAYWFRSPRRGEVLQFNPSRFTIEKPSASAAGSSVISINMTDYFQRVVAVAGDRVERRGGVCYVNGVPLSKEEDAIRAEALGDHAEFTVPAGRVYAPITGIPGDMFQMLAEARMMEGQSQVNRPGLIYQGLEEAGLPSQKEWLARAVALINPPPRRTWF